MSVGATCFGVTVGYITYRTLARTTDSAAITDLSAVVGVIGGGAVTALFNPDRGDLFGWYSIGLLIGIVTYFLAHLLLGFVKGEGAAETRAIMSGRTRLARGVDAGDRTTGPQV
jgi:hypothetical protein